MGKNSRNRNGNSQNGTTKSTEDIVDQNTSENPNQDQDENTQLDDGTTDGAAAPDNEQLGVDSGETEPQKSGGDTDDDGDAAKEETPVVDTQTASEGASTDVQQPAAEIPAASPIVEQPPVEQTPQAPAEQPAPVDSGASGQVVQQQPIESMLKPTEPAPAQVIPQQPQVQDVAAAIAAQTGIEGKVSSESMLILSLRHALDEYLKVMGPGRPVDIKKGSAKQAALYNEIVKVINHFPNSDFQSGMRVLLEYFMNHREGAFHTTYVFRFMEHIEMTKPRITCFQRLLNMFILMADPKGRQAAQGQCNWHETLSGDINDTGRNRVLNYFNIG